jgi:hypothetical protein
MLTLPFNQQLNNSKEEFTELRGTTERVVKKPPIQAG